MLVTVTNFTSNAGSPGPSRTINKLDTLTGGTGVSALSAVGGAKTDPLPYPFAHIGELAAAATKQLPMHPADWRYKAVPWLPEEPSTEWNKLVQGGVVTLTVAAQTDRTDSEELFITAV
jgi:hypothetical protein